MELNEQAVKIAVKIISRPDIEGCSLFAYPDPASPLYDVLSNHGMLNKLMTGKIKYKDLPENFQAISGKPWTIGFGETKDVKPGMECTLEQAKTALEARVRQFMSQAIKDCPKLAQKAPAQIAAITSLCYNIGSDAFKNSTVCKRITTGADDHVAEAIKMWNKAGGKVMAGLVNRRQIESDLWNSK